MKPCSRKALRSSSYLTGAINFTENKMVVSIRGSTKKLDEKYKEAMIVLYNRVDLNPIAVRRPNEDGAYQFLGLNNSFNLFVVALDNNKQYNAVIQDNVVPI